MMRILHRFSRAPLAIAALLLLPALLLAAQPAAAAPLTQPRLLVHLVRATTKVASCAPPLADCASEAVSTYGFTYNTTTEFFYFAYILAAGTDATAGVGEIRLAVDFARETNEGVDVFTWSTCASASLGPTDWFSTGAGNQIRWDDCPKTGVAVAGYFYVTAYTPGKLGIVPPPGEGPATLTACGGQPVEIPPGHLGFAGFGDQLGCNPCLAECDYVAVEPTTWGGIKAHFATPRAAGR